MLHIGTNGVSFNTKDLHLWIEASAGATRLCGLCVPSVRGASGAAVAPPLNNKEIAQCLHLQEVFDDTRLTKDDPSFCYTIFKRAYVANRRSTEGYESVAVSG